jgi:hypothetical protein
MATLFQTILFQTIICAIIFLHVSVGVMAQQQPATDSVNVNVYFSSGIQKSPVHITATHIRTILSQFEISDGDISRTYPNFNEADTLKVNAIGQRFISSNLSRFFTLKLRNKNNLTLLQEKLAQIPEVVFVEFPDTKEERRRLLFLNNK